MNHFQQLVDEYCKVWNEPDTQKKAEALKKIWSPDATYIDPNVSLRGIAELVAHIDRVQAGRPGARIIRTTALQVHHRIGRFGWQLIHADGSRLPEGLDIVFFSEEGQHIDRIIGFFGELHRNI